VTLHPYATVSYRKTPRPPAVYSSDIRVVTANCREHGGEENAITLPPNIFFDGISEPALTREMTGEEAHKHSSDVSSGASKQGGFFFWVIQLYVLRTSLCYTIRRMCSIYASKRPTLLPVGRN